MYKKNVKSKAGANINPTKNSFSKSISLLSDKYKQKDKVKTSIYKAKDNNPLKYSYNFSANDKYYRDFIWKENENDEKKEKMGGTKIQKKPSYNYNYQKSKFSTKTEREKREKEKLEMPKKEKEEKEKKEKEEKEKIEKFRKAKEESKKRDERQKKEREEREKKEREEKCYKRTM